MSEYSYPGIYIQEKSGGPGPITGVSTSNLGLIGFTLKGKVDEPILVTSFPEFESTFGTFTEMGLTPTMAYAFFQNGGQRLYVVRVTASDAVDSGWDYTESVSSGSPESLGNTVVPSGIYSLQLAKTPSVPGTVTITFNDGSTDNIFTDPAGDGNLVASGGGAGGSGFIDYTTNEVSITLTNPGDYSGGGNLITASYDYVIFRFQMIWPGEAGNYYRVQIIPGDNDYLVDSEARWTRFTVLVQEDVDAGSTGIPSWTTVEQFTDLVFDTPTDNNYVVSVINSESDFIEVVEYGNEMNPLELQGTVVTDEDFSATQIHSDGSSAQTPDYYNGKWKGWSYNLAKESFPTTFIASFIFREGGTLMATVGAAPSATAVVVGPDAFDPTLLPLTMDPHAPSVRIGCVLTGVGATNIVDTGVAGPGNLIEVSTGVVVGSINHTTGAITDPTGLIADTLDVSGLGLADTFVANSVLTWVSDTQIGTGTGAVTANVQSLGDTAVPAKVAPNSVRISAKMGDVETNSGATIGFTDVAGTTTLADSTNPFANVNVGDRIAVSGATSSANDGTFIVTNISGAPGAVDYLNPTPGVTEPGIAGTKWTLLPEDIEIVDTGVQAAGNLVQAGTANAVGTIDYDTGEIFDPTGATAGELDLTAISASETFTATQPIRIAADYVEPVKIVDDGDGNLSLADTQNAGYPQKFGLDANGTNELDQDTGVFTLTWALSGSPSAGPAGAVSSLASYYTNPDDQVLSAFNGGTNGSTITSNDVVGASLAGSQRGLWAFGKVDALMQLVASDFQTDTVVADALITYAELTKDKFVILTVPAGLTPQEAVNWKKYQLQKFTSYAALYYPHIKIIDPVTLIPTDVPCGGHVAGIYARTDNNKNVAKAPAGTADGAINWSVGLELDLTPTQVGTVYPEKINALVQWPHTGRCLWGARSLDIAGGEWPYIQMRRLFMFLEKSVFNATHSHVFENNGPSLWARIRTQIVTFLSDLYDSGYFAGSSSDEAFFVICDRTNNPQSTVDQGFVFCDIGVAPQKPAEFIVFRFQQKALAT